MCAVVSVGATPVDELQKKRVARGKNLGKQGSRGAVVPFSVQEGSDSGDNDYHDALPGEE